LITHGASISLREPNSLMVLWNRQNRSPSRVLMSQKMDSGYLLFILICIQRQALPSAKLNAPLTLSLQQEALRPMPLNTMGSKTNHSKY
jgi:hypothetical protein